MLETIASYNFLFTGSDFYWTFYNYTIKLYEGSILVQTLYV